MKHIFFILTFLLIISCDCVKISGGKVIDEKTELPIVRAKVCLSNSPSTFVYTDSTGAYKLRYITWGLGCYMNQKKKVIVEKDGYIKSDEIPINKDIELKPQPQN